MILQDNGVSPGKESSPKNLFPGRKAPCGVVSVHLDLSFAQDIAVVIDSGVVWLNGSGKGTTTAEEARGTPTQSHTSQSILVYEGKIRNRSCKPVKSALVYSVSPLW